MSVDHRTLQVVTQDSSDVSRGPEVSAGRNTTAQQFRLLVGAASVLVIGYVHYYLYFKGGYRGIAPESFAGLTISRAFAVNAVAGLIIAWALVVSLRVPALTAPAAVAGAGFAVVTLGAYVLTRTVGLLGFEDDQRVTEAVVAVVAELVALGSLGSWLASSLRSRARGGQGRVLPSSSSFTCLHRSR
jgi:hypothetical protein